MGVEAGFVLKLKCSSIEDRLAGSAAKKTYQVKHGLIVCFLILFILPEYMYVEMITRAARQVISV